MLNERNYMKLRKPEREPDFNEKTILKGIAGWSFALGAIMLVASKLQLIEQIKQREEAKNKPAITQHMEKQILQQPVVVLAQPQQKTARYETQKIRCFLKADGTKFYTNTDPDPEMRPCP